MWSRRLSPGRETRSKRSFRIAGNRWEKLSKKSTFSISREWQVSWLSLGFQVVLQVSQQVIVAWSSKSDVPKLCSMDCGSSFWADWEMTETTDFYIASLFSQLQLGNNYLTCFFDRRIEGQQAHVKLRSCDSPNTLHSDKTDCISSVDAKASRSVMARSGSRRKQRTSHDQMRFSSLVKTLEETMSA